MAEKDINAEIRVRIEAFAEELSGLIRQAAVEAVQEALAGGGAGKSRRSRGATAGKAPARRARGGKRVRRSEEQIAALGQTIITYVKANPGHRLEEIGRGLEIDTSELKRPISNLMEAKALRTTGQKRGTKYFVRGRASAARKKKAS